jgi:dTDP-4-amino-4,6-dideoxygalactose transaminase
VSVVHYAGVGCALDEIEAICARHGLTLIEDAAQGLLSRADGRPLGSVGRLGALSFHETKNVHCGEGGALLVNDPSLIEAAEEIQEKGTDRAAYFRGEIDHYSWTALGSSYLLSEIAAAFLWAQLEEAERLTERRLEIWSRYHDAFAELEARGAARRPVVPERCRHNAHTYHLLLEGREARDGFIAALGERGILAVFHYAPLHSSPAGRRLGRAEGRLPVTDRAFESLVRLPIWVDMTDEMVDRVVAASLESLDSLAAGAPG